MKRITKVYCNATHVAEFAMLLLLACSNGNQTKESVQGRYLPLASGMSSLAVSVTSGFLIECHMFENVTLTIQIFVPVGARSSPQEES